LGVVLDGIGVIAYVTVYTPLPPATV